MSLQSAALKKIDKYTSPRDAEIYGFFPNEDGDYN